MPAPPCLQRLLVLDIAIKMRGADDSYFEQLGVSGRVRAPPLHVPMAMYYLKRRSVLMS